MEYKVNIHYYSIEVVNLQKEEPEPRREEKRGEEKRRRREEKRREEKRREEKRREVEICARGVSANPLALEQG